MTTPAPVPPRDIGPQPAEEKYPLPKRIGGQKKAYAFERACGLSPARACRTVGGKVENGSATKWEEDADVQRAILHYRYRGQTEDMLAAKRMRIEERLELAAYGDLLEFAELVDEMEWDVAAEKWKLSGRKTVVIDWAKVMASPLRVIVSSFSFHKDTGKLTDFKRDSAENAAQQLRDMHGFSAPKKLGIGNQQDGGPIEVTWKTAQPEGTENGQADNV